MLSTQVRPGWASAPVAPAVGPAVAVHGMEQEPLLVRVFTRRWYLLLICFAAAAAAGYGVAAQYGQSQYSVSGRLLYSRLPTIRDTGYTPTDIITTAELLKSPETIKKVNEELALTTPPTSLYEALEVKATRGTQLIDVTLSWENPTQAAEILNKLLDRFCEQMAEMRKKKVAEFVKDAEVTAHLKNRELASAKKSLRTFQAKNELFQGVDEYVDSLNDEYDAISRERRVIEAMVIKAKTQEAAIQQEQKSIEVMLKKEMLDVLERQYEAKIRNIKVGTPLRASFTPIGDSIKELRAQLDAEEKAALTESTATPPATENSASNATPPAAESSAAKTASEATTAPATAEAAAIGGRTSLVAWTSKLESLSKKLGRSLNEASKDGKHSSALELTEIQREDAKEIRAIESEITARQVQIEIHNEELKKIAVKARDAATLRDESQVLEDKIAQATNSATQANNLWNALKDTENAETKEFSVVSKAEPMVAGFSSTTKKYFAGTFLAVSLLLSLPIIGLEYFSHRESPADEAARRFGLPVLARRVASPANGANGDFGDVADEDDLRLLALRIQQAVNKPGSIMMFSALDQSQSPINLLSQLAECFAQRDERVLVVDAGKTPTSQEMLRQLLPSTAELLPALPEGIAAPNGIIATNEDGLPKLPGLSDYLSFACVGLDDLVLPTKIGGVDVVLNGSLPFPREGLATQRMSELLDQCRDRYSLILVAGPGASQPADLQMMAARADGIVFTVNSSRKVDRAGQQVLHELLSLEAPVMGVVG